MSEKVSWPFQHVGRIMTKNILSDTQKATTRVSGIVIPVVKKQGRLRLSKRTDIQGTQLAPAYYVGWQEGTTQNKGFSLYTLTEEIPGHSQWSTVSGKTLEDAGFMLPTRRVEREHETRLFSLGCWDLLPTR